LKDLPFHIIKTDQSFIRDLLNDPADAALTIAPVEMAHGLGKRVIAEGVETETQQERLRGIGCGAGQGYLFSRPVTAHELEAQGWLDKGRP